MFLINYSYTIPKLTSNKALGAAINGWTIGGQTVAQSGQPYSIYDYSGSVGSLYFGTSDYIGNPIVPLEPGVTTQQAQLQGTTGVNAGKPVLNVNDFAPAVCGARDQRRAALRRIRLRPLRIALWQLRPEHFPRVRSRCAST